MGVPIMYQGSKYAPVPFVPIPPEPGANPQFSSAEIGAVNASTLVVTFDQDVLAAENDYALGVTIKVNGVATSMTGGIRQTNHAIIYYDIPVLWHGSGDTVTWEYNSAVGIIVAETGGAALGNVAAQSVTNNCEYAALLDVQADTLALNDGDPVSTWTDQSGQSHNFTQTGTARPTKQTTGGYSEVVFDGINDWMLGSNFADNLNGFMVMSFIYVPAGKRSINLNKIANVSTGGGWDSSPVETPFEQEAGGDNYVISNSLGINNDLYLVFTLDFISYHAIQDFINGTFDFDSTETGSVSTITNNEPVRLGTYGDLSKFSGSKMRAQMILYPRPNATNRAALETRLGARYGLTVP